jgi:hypothetical protein
MVTDELIRLLHDDGRTRGGLGPDLERIHRLARRRRATRGVAAGVVAILVVAVAGGAWFALSPGGSPTHVKVRSAGQDHQVTGLSPYERKTLRDIPAAYAVDGTVVLPDTPDPGPDLYDRVPPGWRFVGDPIPLGFHTMVGPGYLSSSKPQHAYQVNAPKGSQVVVDAGPSWLGCQGRKHRAAGAPCAPVVLGKTVDGTFYYLYGLGTDKFLKPGSEMELFTDDDFSDHHWSGTLIGGFHGTSTARVLVDLVNGSQVEAQFSAGELSPGNTMFWATVPSAIARVRAYDASGKLIEEHKLRSCSSPVDCEVR